MKDLLTQGNDVADFLMNQIDEARDGVTSSQAKRLKSDWEKIAKEGIEVEEIKGTFYGFGSELATLRLLKKYTANGQTANKKIKADYSNGRNSHFFRLET
jgi:hypothetical protein